ncbi:MAG: hypothetical protein ACTHJ4_00575 [Candidatus Nucleicultricaceae bacterium]
MDYRLLLHRDILNAGGSLDSGKFEWEAKSQGNFLQQANIKARRSQDAEREVGFRFVCPTICECTYPITIQKAGDTDTIRSIESATITTTEEKSMNCTGNGEMGIEDTLDDVPNGVVMHKANQKKKEETDKKR